MTISEQYKKRIKEFENLGGDDLLEHWDNNPLPESHLTRGFDYPETARELDPDKVINFIKQSFIQICKSEIKRLDGNMFVDSAEAGQFAMHSDGYNNALEDQIDYWQKEKELITNG